MDGAPLMSAKRYELNETQWGRIAPLLPGKAGDPGRTAQDNRLFVNGVLWVLRSGPTGATFLSVMAAGRRCTSGSVAGPELAYGIGCSPT
jgi:hypothetical protein